MRRLRAILRSIFITNRPLTSLVVLTLICAVAAISTGFWLTWRLVYVGIIGIPVAFAWSRVNLAGLEITADRTDDRLQVGAEYEERITIRNRSWLSKIWLEIDDPSEMPGHDARRVVTVGARASKSFRVRSTIARRGLYTVGPVEVRTSDPFGLFRHSKRFGRAQNVLVYPRAVELPGFSLPPANLPGEGRFRRRTHFVTPNASGVRQYEFGDSFNRIHWSSTARTGELMVKIFELDPASDIWIILDLQRGVHFGANSERNGRAAIASLSRTRAVRRQGEQRRGTGQRVAPRHHARSVARTAGAANRRLGSEDSALKRAPHDIAAAVAAAYAALCNLRAAHPAAAHCQEQPRQLHAVRRSRGG